jgi:hypothetical protein
VGEHTLLYDYGNKENMIEQMIEDFNYYQKCREFISQNIGKIYTIEETRKAVLNFLKNC